MGYPDGDMIRAAIEARERARKDRERARIERARKDREKLRQVGLRTGRRV